MQVTFKYSIHSSHQSDHLSSFAEACHLSVVHSRFMMKGRREGEDLRLTLCVCAS